MSQPFSIRPAGDAALVVSARPAIDAEINSWCVRLGEAVERTFGTAVRDVVVGFCTVTVFFDPLRTDASWLEAELSRLASEERPALDEGGAVIDVPVCYGGAYGPDLERVAALHESSVEQVIARHSAALYRVYMLGYVPGFAYLGIVDETIATPRLETPRTRVPAGSVGIADRQTGVYPAETPGGWNLIGRTPLRPFDPARQEPFLFRPGDQVRFRPVDEDEFLTLEAACAPSR